MGASSLRPTLCTHENLSRAASISAPHLKMLFEAVSDGDIRLGLVRQHGGPFAFPPGAPIVLLMGDDYDLCYGPQAFDRDSIAEFVKGATSALIVSGMPDPMAYDAAVARAATTGHHSIIVETSEAWEDTWLALLHTLAPDMPLLVSSLRLKGARA